MKNCTILEKLASCETNYRPLPSLELTGENRACTVKCEEGLFLVPVPDGFCLIDQAAGNEYTKDRLPASSQDLSGWHADLALAPGFGVPCDFKDNALVLDGTEIPVQVGLVRPGCYLIAGSEDPFALVLDISRFLLYGIVLGKVFGGYIRNMPQN